jgi:O-antigen/teichoic acid export membrane protein
MTAAHVRNDRPIVAMLALISLSSTAVIVVPATLAFLLWGPAALSLLSNSKLHADSTLFFWLALTAAFQAGWTTVGQFLVAINKQQEFAYHYVFLAAVAAASPSLLSGGSILVDVAAVWCTTEMIMFVVVYRAWWRENRLLSEDFVHASKRLYKYLNISRL